MANNPWEMTWTPTTAQTAPPAVPQGRIDFNRPDEQVRADVMALPEEERTGAMNEWADTKVADEDAQGGWAGVTRGVDNTARAFARGVPFIGSYGDEANAWLADRMYAHGVGGAPYDEQIAYERARDRSFQSRHPYTAWIPQLVGSIVAPGGYIKGAGALANVGYQGLQGLVGGFGEGEGSPLTAEGLWDRGKSAAISGAGAAALSSVFNPTIRFARDYARSNITPAIVSAANTLGVDLPHFLRTANPGVQAAGVRSAQLNPGSPLDVAYRQSREGLEQAGERTIRGVTGAPAETAPNVVGQNVIGSLKDTTGRNVDEMAALTESIMKMLPPNVRMNPQATRQAVNDIITKRIGRGIEGELPSDSGILLKQARNLVNREGGVNYNDFSGYTTDVGRALGQHPLLPRDMPSAEWSQLYHAAQGVDKPGFVQAAAPMVGGQYGPAARAQFEAATARQHSLGDVNRSIEDIIGSMGDKLSPEQMINRLHTNATVSGAGTNLDELRTILSNVPVAQREQIGAALWAKMQNASRVAEKPLSEAENAALTNVQDAAGNAFNPGAFAKQVGNLASGPRAEIFQPGSPLAQQLDAAAALATRLASAAKLQHVGSAGTLGDKMTSALFSPGGYAAAAGGLAKLVGMPWAVSGPMAAASAIRGAQYLGLDKLLPFAAQHGLSEGSQYALGQLVSGASRNVGQGTAQMLRVDPAQQR